MIKRGIYDSINIHKINNIKKFHNPVKINQNIPISVIKQNNQFIPTFNILIATIGRESLENLIESLSEELTENDCLTIVFDNNTIRSIKNIEKIKAKVNIHNEFTKLGYWGHGIRNKYSSILEKRDFILHADDDDTYFPNSFDKLRKQCMDKNTLYISKMLSNKIAIPRDNINIFIGNISTSCGIIPYHLNDKGNWGYFYGGDGSYYLEIIKKSKVKRLNTIIYNYGNTKENSSYFKLIPS
jgi:hypothetical protein